MRENGFTFSMTKKEKILGWAYIPVHIFALPLLLPAVSLILQGGGLVIGDAELNFVYYLLGFLFFFFALKEYLSENFILFSENLWSSLYSAWLNLGLYYVVGYAVNVFIGFVLPEIVNPNTEVVINDAVESFRTMFAVSVLLAPIVEEIIFRGVIFGNVYSKSRIGAYVASAMVFSVYHLWQFAFAGYGIVELGIYCLQYLPASIMLCRCYEETNNLYGPIAMHMMVNFIAIMMTKLM